MRTSLLKLEELTNEFSVLIRGLEATELMKDLGKPEPEEQKGKKKKGAEPVPMTLFAPTNSAFAQLPQDCLLSDCERKVSSSDYEIVPAFISVSAQAGCEERCAGLTGVKELDLPAEQRVRLQPECTTAKS